MHALSLVCTHLGCLVEWNAERRQLTCPCHRAAFGLVRSAPSLLMARVRTPADLHRVFGRIERLGAPADWLARAALAAAAAGLVVFAAVGG